MIDVLDKAGLSLIAGLANQISITVSNIMANEKVISQLDVIKRYKQQLEEEKIYLKEEIETSHNYSEIIGNGPEMQKVFHLVSKVAASDSTVLILGETGTGKELIARAIHNNSPRKNSLMVKVNCATLPVNLIESELFGHERGSFTGATERRIGKFELANNGTLFLDEIGDLPLELPSPKPKESNQPSQKYFSLKTIDENEREHILNILKYCKGKVTGEGGAAQLLGVPNSTLSSKMKRLGIKKEHFK